MKKILTIILTITMPAFLTLSCAAIGAGIGAGFVTQVETLDSEGNGEVRAMRHRAEDQLRAGGKEADRGNLERALFFLDEALRLAIAADDPSLRIRARLSRSNVLFSLGRGEEAAQGWNEALAEAERAGNSELAAVCRIHSARGKLLERAGQGAASVQSIRDDINKDLSLIKDRLYTAFGWMTAALAEKELGRYPAAEAAFRRSLEIHDKDRYFELAAYDWYLIASCRSLAGDFSGARQALESAMDYDRRVENSWGLASDWRALGDVYRKAGDAQAARAAYTRSAEIFRALGSESAAESALQRME